MFNEDTRVKLPAVAHLMKLGFKYVSKRTSKIDKQLNLFVDIFKDSIQKINNQAISDSEFEALFLELKRILSFNDSGKTFFEKITDSTSKLKLIDFENFDNNELHVVTELPFGNSDKFRPDITLLINGMPLSIIEVKQPNNEGGIDVEFERLINERIAKDEFKHYFNMIQLMVFSNNMPYLPLEQIVPGYKFQGSFYSTPNGLKTDFNYFREEEKIEVTASINEIELSDMVEDNGYNPDIIHTDEFKTNSNIDSPLNSFLTSLFSKERLSFLLRFGIMYVDNKEKHIIRYPQFFALMNMKRDIENENEGGVVWHTQGSGKTALAAFAVRYLQYLYAKKGIISRFFFVVDRLDLLKQASDEFTIRNFEVKKVNSKEEFAKELNKISGLGKGVKRSLGEVVIVNIQKIIDDLPVANNDYEAKIKRVIFVDEAHRSYKSGGEFYKNLRTIDREANYYALTGTPILSKKERSNLKFGKYIHKYFFDKSISDGFTLRIKREPVRAVFHDSIKNNIEISENELTTLDILESNDYVSSVSKYINDDFKNFQTIHSDPSLGSMIVTKSSTQAKKIYDWFCQNSNFKVGLVLFDSENKDKIQEDFRKGDKYPEDIEYDILIVYSMLTTGYDVRRLKKMYILRAPDKHTLLQTISRVNRPYTNPFNGNKYQFGYIADFADIEINYDKTLSQYVKELEIDSSSDTDENLDYTGLVTDYSEIYKEYQKNFNNLSAIIETNNLEEFSIQLARLDKKYILDIRKMLQRISDCQIEFIISGFTNLTELITREKVKYMLKETNNRIRLLNLIENPISVLGSQYINDNDIVEVIYGFIFQQEVVLDIKVPNEKRDSLSNVFSKIRKGIASNINRNNPKIVSIETRLKKVLEKLTIFDLDMLADINKELQNIYEEINAINKENEETAKFFDGDLGYVKTIEEYISENPKVNKDDLINFMVIIKKNVDILTTVNRLLYKNKATFITALKKQTAKQMLINGLYVKLDLANAYNTLLRIVYNNVDLIK